MDKSETSKDKRGLAEQFERAWTHALLAVSTVEDEIAKVSQWLTERAGWGHDESRRVVRELSDRLIQQRKDLESSVEEGARKALQRVKLPKREEVQALSARMERVAQRIEALQPRALNGAVSKP